MIFTLILIFSTIFWLYRYFSVNKLNLFFHTFFNNKINGNLKIEDYSEYSLEVNFFYFCLFPKNGQVHLTEQGLAKEISINIATVTQDRKKYILINDVALKNISTDGKKIIAELVGLNNNRKKIQEPIISTLGEVLSTKIDISERTILIDFLIIYLNIYVQNFSTTLEQQARVEVKKLKVFEYINVTFEDIFSSYNFHQKLKEEQIIKENLIRDQVQKFLDVLDLTYDPSLTLNDIKKRTRTLSKKYHPDKYGSEEKFIEVREAYDELLVYYKE